MKILYLTKEKEDYLADNILYGLRQKFGVDVVDFPRKDVMYKNSVVPSDAIYGFGFTMWKLLDDIEIDRSQIFDQLMANYFDIVIFSSIYRMQDTFAHFTVFDFFKRVKSKFVFFDGEDDGFPTVYDAFHRGTYFKRDNPFQYPQVNIIGLSIPAQKVLSEKPKKERLFTTYVQCEEAYKIEEIAQNCTNQRVFFTEESYYQDLANSKYGITMKKSGWDVPRHMENASHWVVNCIRNFDEKPDYVHPLGLKDMENCIVWHDAEELRNKVLKVEKEGQYDKLQQGSHDWVLTKTCEAMTDYMLSKL